MSDYRHLPMGQTLSDGANKYTVEKILGSGGFGITYLAIDDKLGRKVAIKEYYPGEFAGRDSTKSVVPTTADQAEIFEWGKDRFLDEARKLAKFSHPNLLSVQGYFEQNNTAYIIMPFLNGETLDQRYRRKLLSQTEALGVLEQLIDGLNVMHVSGELHRDIKPSNIILCGPKETPVLIDFGAARSQLGEKSQSMDALVSTPYSPIEQYSSSMPQGPASDIYSLGATVYRAMFGSGPPEPIGRDSEDTLPELDQAARSNIIAPKFAHTLRTCLSYKSADRFESLDKLVLALSDTPTTMAKKVRNFVKNGFISFIIVVGSSGEFFLFPSSLSDDEKNLPEYIDWEEVYFEPPDTALQDRDVEGQAKSQAQATDTVQTFSEAEGQAEENQAEFYIGWEEVYFEPPDTTLQDRDVEDQAWAQAQAKNTIQAYNAYLTVYPDGRFAQDAADRRSVLIAEDQAWETARTTNSLKGYRNFLTAYPDGRFSHEALTATTWSRFDPEYTAITEQIQEILIEEACLDGIPDGLFGERSAGAMLDFAAEIGKLCGANSSALDPISSTSPVPNGWIEQAKEWIRDIDGCNLPRADVCQAPFVFQLSRQQFRNRFYEVGDGFNYTIVGSELSEEAAQGKANYINLAYPDVFAFVYPPLGNNPYWAVMLASLTTREKAVEAMRIARSSGIASDAYVWP